MLILSFKESISLISIDENTLIISLSLFTKTKSNVNNKAPFYDVLLSQHRHGVPYFLYIVAL
ncbi:hypothetical protein DXX94_01115 [Thalassotalea euphylliae]|uniref:Uncharacterized protein n=1 Tax=Thalassotalea euphylliae TaxID=1655234 RepID=A0A3E0TYJ1_9GAMM|nr:hypothetical protein DXX94_01115 [Thalassotalea euphylliae]